MKISDPAISTCLDRQHVSNLPALVPDGNTLQIESLIVIFNIQNQILWKHILLHVLHMGNVITNPSSVV